MLRYKKAKFLDVKSDVPVIEFMLSDGTVGHAIIDTGSEVTIFDLSFVSKNKSMFSSEVKKEKIELVGLASNDDNFIISADADIYFNTDKGNNMVSIKNAMAIPLNNISENLERQGEENAHIDALIGSDTLSKIFARIDFKNREVKYL